MTPRIVKMTPTEAFIRSEHALNGVVQQIRDDQWSMTMPPEFQISTPNPDLTLRDVIAYHAYDDAWIPDMLAGRTMDEVGKAAFDGDLLGDDPRGSFGVIVAKAIDAAEQLDDLDRPVHWSYGDFAARDGLWHVISFRGLRAIDLARVLGVDDQLDPELIQAMWDEFLPNAETWRQMGVFGPAIDVPEDAPLQARLLGLTGRQP
jgi:uncharacterized protein (TIGR03086 family)